MMTKMMVLPLTLSAGFFLFTPVFAATLDSDQDGLSDNDEIHVYATNPQDADTDEDSYLDGREIAGGYSPHAGPDVRMSQHDLDNDGLTDLIETKFHTNLGKIDTDSDGHSDYDEIMFGYDPTSPAPSVRLSRAVVVDRTTQRMAFLVSGMEMKNFPVSTGNPFTPTPAGTFAVQAKREYVDYIGVGYNYPRIKWNLQFLPHYYLHTATWHNDFGKRTRSHGCVNMRESDAAFLFKYLEVGVPVTVTGTTPAHLYVASK